MAQTTNPCVEIKGPGYNIRTLLRYLTGKRWASKVLATTEHGTHTFEVIGVEGQLNGDTILRLRTILPELVHDREGDVWGLQSDGTYSVCHEDPVTHEVRVAGGTLYTGYSLADIEREYGLKK